MPFGSSGCAPSIAFPLGGKAFVLDTELVRADETLAAKFLQSEGFVIKSGDGLVQLEELGIGAGLGIFYLA